MATSNERYEAAVNGIIATSDLTTNRQYHGNELADAVEAAVPDDAGAGNSAFVIGPAPTMSVSGSAPDRLISVANGTVRRFFGYAQGELLAWDSNEDGFADIPFADVSGRTYQIGVRHNDYPTQARVKTDGAYWYAKYKQGVGELVTPTAVVDTSPGLRLTVTSGTISQWTDVTQSRPCTVWLATPKTASAEAIYTGTVDLVSGALVVDVPHYLGQSVVSTTGSDYRVLVHGIRVADTATYDLTTITADGRRTYVVLGTFDVDAGTFDYTAQIRVPSLQELAGGALLNSGLDAIVRAGAHIGTYGQTREWNLSGNISVDSSGDPVTLTFSDPLATVTSGDGYFFAGTVAGEPRRIAQDKTASGNIATIAKSAATGTYHVVVETELVGETPKWKLSIITDAAWTGGGAALRRRVLHVCSFAFTTSTGAVASISSTDLSVYRGVLFASAISSLSDENYQSFMASVVGAEAFDIRIRAESGTNYGATRAVRVSRDVANQETTVTVEALAGAGGSLASGDHAQIELGGANDYRLDGRYDGATRELAVQLGGSDVAVFDADDGNAVDGTNRLVVQDLALSGNGKLVWVMVPPHPGQGQATWTYDTAEFRWESDGTHSEYLEIPVPAGRLGDGMQIVAAAVFMGTLSGGSGLSETMDAALVFRAMNTGGSTPYTTDTVVTDATASVDISGGVVAPDWVTLGPFSAHTVQTNGYYLIRVHIGTADTGGVPRVYMARVQFRVAELT